MADAETKPADEAQNKTSWTDPIPLAEPIRRGTKEIGELQLRKPKSGELRGLSLQDVLTTDITTIMKLIPRISEPKLTPEETDELDPADLAEIGGAIRGFFMTKAERQMLDAMVAEQQPRS